MTLKTNPLRDAITFALFVSATALTGTGVAFAQAAPARPAPATTAQPAALDRIVVTGTRIQSQTVTASSPVTEIQKEEFQYAGATRTEDLVNQYPQLQPAFDAFTNNGALGYPTVDLRGLGPQRTLTLVNGFRLPMGGGIVPDISIIPASLIKRVDLLTGGASAVYGSDAVAGVVNFILDTDFEGVSLTVGKSGYQHNNDNRYMQNLEKSRGFIAPSGNSGIGGISNNIDIAVGSSFADGRGHAMAWLTWRKNDALFQGARDYSACALNQTGTACGGSNTNAAGNFYFYQPGTGAGSRASLNPNGSFKNSYGAPYNYAPINYYQRPDERYTFGSSLRYEVNEHFQPYLETMFINKKDSVQIAPSGAFFTQVPGINCTDPLIGSACSDLGINPAGGPVNIYVAKRNIEGGPRYTSTNNNYFRVVTGAKGAIDENWSYNASFLYGQNSSNTVGINDFLTSRISQAILGCQPGNTFPGCLPYNVFIPGGVTPAAAQAMQGTSLNTTTTQLSALSAYITGNLGYGFGSAKGDTIGVVVGAESREEKYAFNADSNAQAGNFAGAGGPTLPLAGKITVKEVFSEVAIPILKDVGPFKRAGVELGYRLSDYNLAGKAETFKIGASATMGWVTARGGYNRAIRAPNVGELFPGQQIALFAGSDGCAGPTPVYTAAQCANTGVPAGRYGRVPDNSAAQYNQFVGGNLNLTPEIADTYTLGFVVTPTEALRVNLDYYDVKVTNAIRTIGAQNILDFCATTGQPFFCSLVRRNPSSGDLWRGNDPATSGLVRNLLSNFGENRYRGLDLGARYHWDMLGGQFTTNFQGNYLLEQETTLLPGISAAGTYDCKGRINSSCQSPKWRHIANIRYSRDWLTLNLRWRYFGQLDYVDNNGKPLTFDQLLVNNGNKINAQNYLDLSASTLVGSWGEFTVGVNNITDRAPPLIGLGLGPANANSPGGYDQAGRYLFTSFNVRF